MYTLPNIAVPESEKQKEEYYERFVRAFSSNTFTGNWALNYNKMKLLYSFYLDGTGSDLTGYLTTAPDGSAMPGIFVSINTAKTRIRTLVGEMEERSYLIKARAVNPEAQSRKREEQERLRVKRKLQSLRLDVEGETGIPLESPEYVPQSDAELREYMDLSWKDKNVLILEGALKWTALRDNADEMRKRLLLDQFIANVSVVRNEIVDGVNTYKNLDPLKFGADSTATGDMLEDATVFHELEYRPLAEIAQRYGLTEDELKASYDNYELGKGVGGTNDPGWGCMPMQVVKWYDNVNNIPKGLVLKVVWRDYKELSHKKETKSKYGAEFLQDVTGKHISEGDQDKIVSNKIECWRQATLIGGQFLREWGECYNQPRELNSLQKARPPYTVWVNENLPGGTSSLLEQLVGLQTLKDIAMYQLQIQQARAVGRVLVFDEAMIPEGQSRETILRYIKADGIVFVNSKEYQQISGGMNLFKDYDLSLSASVAQAIQMVEYYDQQMDRVSGITPERQGEVSGSSVSTGTTTAALVQSKMVTSTFFKAFERFYSRILQYQAGLVKIAWANKEKFATIIGDVGVDFLGDNIDISLDEFDVFVQSLPPSSFDKQILIDWLNMAVQADPGFLSDAMGIMLEPDITQAVREFQRKDRLRKRLLAQQAQQQAEAEQAEADADREVQMQIEQSRQQNERAVQGQKDQSGLQKTIATGRVKLQSEKLKLLTK